MQRKRLLLPGEAGKVLGIGACRVRQLTNEGRLPAVITMSGRRLLREHDVLRFAEERKRAANERSKTR